MSASSRSGRSHRMTYVLMGLGAIVLIAVVIGMKKKGG